MGQRFRLYPLPQSLAETISSFRIARAGFSLIEVCVSIAIASVLIVAGMAWLKTVYLLYNKESYSLEGAAMAEAAFRTIEQDAHAAASANFTFGQLVLTMLDAKQYVYYVNAAHQMIRYQTGGGDAVISAHVAALTERVNGSLIHVTITLLDGEQFVFAAKIGGVSFASGTAH